MPDEQTQVQTPTTAAAATDTAASSPITQQIDDQAATALTVLEQDAIEFIRASVQRAKDAIPLLTGELGDGLNSLLHHAEALAAKHGFKL